MDQTLEMNGPAGRIVVRFDEIQEKLRRGYTFATPEGQAAWDESRRPKVPASTGNVAAARGPATIDPEKAMIGPAPEVTGEFVETEDDE